MAKAKEFTVTIADKPGALGKCFLALAEHGVNILAFQSYVEERESLVRFLADDMATAQAVLGGMVGGGLHGKIQLRFAESRIRC